MTDFICYATSFEDGIKSIIMDFFRHRSVILPHNQDCKHASRPNTTTVGPDIHLIQFNGVAPANMEGANGCVRFAINRPAMGTLQCPKHDIDDTGE